MDQIPKDLLKRTLKRSEILDFKSYTFVFGYHRLAINDKTVDGDQPFEWYPPLKTFGTTISRGDGDDSRPSSNSKKISICSGEIWNWKSLKELYNLDDQFVSESDCEIILHLYRTVGFEKMLELIDGEFALVIGDNIQTYDKKKMNVFVARDPMGLKPLYFLRKKDDSLILFVSELKGIPLQFLDNPAYEISEFPAGHYWSFKSNSFVRYYHGNDVIKNYTYNDTAPETIENLYKDINTVLKKSLLKRIPASKFAITISGGLSSSILANMVLELISNFEVPLPMVTVSDPVRAIFEVIEFFTLGQLDDNDIKMSKELINFFNQKYNYSFTHHIITVDTKIDLKERREHISTILETNNEKLIETCIPLSFIYEYMLKNTPDIKVVICGDGLDTLLNNNSSMCKGTFTDAVEQSRTGSARRQGNLELKVDKLSGFYQIETRTPYFDVEFVELCRNINPLLKEPVAIESGVIEKYLLRKANQTSDNPLPNKILFRQPYYVNLR
jgi:asparagine synthase (glutamine-hydrolysing)